MVTIKYKTKRVYGMARNYAVDENKKRIIKLLTEKESISQEFIKLIGELSEGQISFEEERAVTETQTNSNIEETFNKIYV